MSDVLVPILTSASNVCCDVCGEPSGVGAEGPYAALIAGWAPSQPSDGDRYLVGLCKACFMIVLGDLKLQCRVRTMFDEIEEDVDGFGKVKSNAPTSIIFGCNDA